MKDKSILDHISLLNRCSCDKCKEEIIYWRKKLNKSEEDNVLNDKILGIIPPALPYGLDDKVFRTVDDEGNIGEPFSYNDQLKLLDQMSGINEELMGKLYRSFDELFRCK